LFQLKLSQYSGL